MTAVTIYHNPRCSKSRQTLELLEAQGADISVVPYLEAPPARQELADIVNMLGVAAVEIVRTGEEEYKSSGLTNESTDDQVIDAILKTPKLMQRPIVVAGKQARIGRPPEAVLEIL